MPNQKQPPLVGVALANISQGLVESEEIDKVSSRVAVHRGGSRLHVVPTLDIPIEEFTQPQARPWFHEAYCCKLGVGIIGKLGNPPGRLCVDVARDALRH
ncbi:MAG: hypothetical protein AMJ75_01310 [Phycisphaerae bacterium SM1_79]|nr:MAG: hypothetical protein AMJ75_01310 [Phycisphaerae bacterium SM1_79]